MLSLWRSRSLLTELPNFILVLASLLPTWQPELSYYNQNEVLRAEKIKQGPYNSAAMIQYHASWSTWEGSGFISRELSKHNRHMHAHDPGMADAGNGSQL